MPRDDELAPALEVSQHSLHGGVRLLALRGELDVATAPALRQALDAALDDTTPRLLVDLAEVTFIDSTALMTLLNALRRTVRRGGRLALVCANPTVLRLFEATRTDTTFAIFPSREEAVGHVGR